MWPNIIVAVERIPHPVRLFVDVEPFLPRGLVFHEALAHVVHEDLGAPSGQRIEPRGTKPLQRLGHGDPRHLVDVNDFGGGQCVQPEVGEALLEPGEELFVVFDLELRVVAALQENLVAAEFVRLGDLLFDLFDWQDVPLVVPGLPVERAEGAKRVTHVRVVDVAVDDVGDDAVDVHAAPHQVGHHS